MCLAVASYGSSATIKIHVSLCGNAEKGGRGIKRVDRRRSQIGGELPLSRNSEETVCEETKYRGVDKGDEELEGVGAPIIIAFILTDR